MQRASAVPPIIECSSSMYGDGLLFGPDFVRQKVCVIITATALYAGKWLLRPTVKYFPPR